MSARIVIDLRSSLAIVGACGLLAACSFNRNQPPPAIAPPVAIAPEPATLARDPAPIGSPGNWFATSDYPSRALREEREGVAEVQLNVGSDGRAIDCSVVSSSGHPDLDSATCSNIKRRARFDPALDAEGAPTTGTYTSRVRWQIPETSHDPLPISGSFTSEKSVNHYGHIVGCRITQSSGDLAARNPVGRVACDQWYSYPPLLDRRGRPMGRTIVTRREVEFRRVAEDFVPRSEGQASWEVRNYQPALTGRIVRSYIVETDGRQTHCLIASVSGDMAETTRPGAYGCQIGRFVGPFLDAQGQPERRQVIETERVRESRRR